MRRRTIPLVALAAALAGAAPADATLVATIGDDQGPNHDRIVVARDDGTHSRVVGAGQSALVSPNGGRVAVTQYPSQGTGPVRLKVFAAAGGPPKLSIRADLIVWGWAPGSRTLVASDGAARRLFLIDARTGARTRLVSTRGSFSRPTFSPDGSRLAYVDHTRQSPFGGTLKVLDLATRRTHMLQRHVDDPTWGPRRIAVSVIARRHSQSVWNVATVKPSGNGFRRLTHIHPTARFFGLAPLAWSRDGRRLATRTIGSDGYWLNAYGVDAVHGGARLIAPHVEATGLSRDGRYIIGQTGDVECCGFAFTDIVRVPWTGGAEQVLIHHAMGASYSG